MLSAWLSSKVSVRHDEPDQPLEERWSSALEHAEKNKFKSGFWMAYGIRRPVGGKALAGTTNVNPLSYLNALGGILRGEMNEATQDVIFLFRFKPGGVEATDIDRIEVSNRPWMLDLGSRPIIWLGQAAEEQSMPRLAQLYRQLYLTQPAPDIIAAAAAHGKPELLEQLAATLEEIAFTDRHPGVQRGTIDLLFQLPFGAGLDSIINLAKTHPLTTVRNEAKQYLQESQSSRARAALQELERES